MIFVYINEMKVASSSYSGFYFVFLCFVFGRLEI